MHTFLLIRQKSIMWLFLLQWSDIANFNFFFYCSCEDESSCCFLFAFFRMFFFPCVEYSSCFSRVRFTSMVFHTLHFLSCSILPLGCTRSCSCSFVCGVTAVFFHDRLYWVSENQPLGQGEDHRIRVQQTQTSDQGGHQDQEAG